MTGLSLPKIYPITDTQISGLSHVEQVRRFVDGGATFVQIREKHAPAGEFYRAAERVVELAKRSGVKIIVNDRVDIAAAVGADGVHLGQEDLSPFEARKLLGDTALIGYSTHNMEQVRAALAMPIDYIAIGPIFETSTKLDADPLVGLEGLRSVRELVGQFPVVAIGGITRTNIREVLTAGADSAAIISDLLSDTEQITPLFREILTTG